MILLKFIDDPKSKQIDSYLSRGGYNAARKAITQMNSREVIEVVKQSGLRGRGGAGFPTGQKWSFVPLDSPKPKYLICNADEGEPGTFKDRVLLENDPHAVIEGMMIASYAIGSNCAFIYLRGEFDVAYEVFCKAVNDCYSKGFLGRGIFSTSYNLEIITHRGAGAYICGEETALLNSIEGERGYPRIRPPFPAVEGLFGCPTIINNVETLANLAYIISNGASSFRQFGTEKSTGTKLYCVSGHVKRPGLYEAPLGIPLKSLLDMAGGILDDKKLKAVIPGGTSSGVLTADEVDIPMDFESLQAKGLMLGSGGVIVMHEDTCMVDALWNITRFYHHESCGQCTPCREGTGWLEKIVARIEHGKGSDVLHHGACSAHKEELDLLVSISNNMIGRTICVFADAVAIPVKHFVTKFRTEFEKHIELGHCPFKMSARSAQMNPVRYEII